jgi:hypothetical protein
MSARTAERSRREVFSAHADRSRLRRCPVCGRALELDHAEALALDARGRPEAPAPRSPAAEARRADSELVSGFALV